jgi:hypothetical protein
MRFLLDSPHRFDAEARVRLTTKSLEMVPGEAQPTDLEASALRELAEDVDLPSYYFLLDSAEWNVYEKFTDEATQVITGIIDYHLSGEHLDVLRDYVARSYPRLIRAVEGRSPDAFLDMLYDKLRQQVLDGNTCFLQYKIPISAYLYQVLKNVLRDQAREEMTKKANRVTPLSQLEDDSRVWQYEAKPERVPLKPGRVTEVLTYALAAVTCAEDRHTLEDALIHVPLAGNPLSPAGETRARRALLVWAPRVFETCEDHLVVLPDTYRDLLQGYALSEWAEGIRALIRCDSLVHAQGRTRSWLSRELGVPECTLGKWIRCESFPRKEQVDRLKEAIPRVEKLLETPDHGHAAADDKRIACST